VLKPRTPAWLGHWRPDPALAEAAFAVVLVGLSQVAVWSGGEPVDHRLPAAAVGLAMTAPIAVRRRYPASVGVSIPVVAAFEAELLGLTSIAYPLATFSALYALAVWTPTRRFVAGLAAVVAAPLIAAVVAGDGFAGAGSWIAIVATVMLLVRRVVGDRDRRAQLAERERDVAAREAVLEERARIARELHDVIAHNVSMMVLQAGAERRVLKGADGSTTQALRAIESTGRSALTEMRRLVGMLRRDGAEPLAPQPGLADLPDLVTSVRAAGLPVDFAVAGERRDLPAGIELSAYRIVQEALTNALRHAGQARASVRLRYAEDKLEVEVVDDGTGVTSAATGGHGLVGMRERVALYGGRFAAAGRPEGGFAVRVELPVQ
jgi:signal transduction histidine kinase